MLITDNNTGKVSIHASVKRRHVTIEEDDAVVQFRSTPP